MQRTWGQEFQAKSKCKGPVVAASWSVWWVGAARPCSWRRIVQTGQGGRQEPHHAHRRSKKTHFYFESNGKLLKLLGFYLTMMVWPPDWRVECICVRAGRLPRAEAGRWSRRLLSSNNPDKKRRWAKPHGSPGGWRKVSERKVSLEVKLKLSKRKSIRMGKRLPGF